MLQLLRRVAPWFFAVVLFTAGWHLGSNSMDNHWKEVIHNEYVAKTEARVETQRRVDAVAQKYQEDLAALEGSTDRIIDDLKRDNKRLSVRVKVARSSEGIGRCEFNGRAELDERDAKRIVAVTQKADAWIKALQDTIRELQKEK